MQRLPATQFHIDLTEIFSKPHESFHVIFRFVLQLQDFGTFDGSSLALIPIDLTEFRRRTATFNRFNVIFARILQGPRELQKSGGAKSPILPHFSENSSFIAFF